MKGNRVKVLVAAAATLFSAGSAFAQAAGGVVISQFAVRGPAGGNDEFVEIFNSGSSPVAIGGWTLQGCANGTPGNPAVRATVPGGTSLAAGQFYLFANTAAAGYSLGVAPDVTYATGFTDFSAAGFSGIRLVAGNSVVATAPFVDAVGSPGSPCREGTGIATPAAPGGTSYAFLRRLVAGAVQDGNDNATDFPGPAAAGAPRNSTTIIGGGGGNLPTVSLAVEPAAFSELGGSAVITATLSAASTAPVTVNLLFGGAASNGSDYSASTASLSIPAGELSATLTLSAIDDTIFEGDETITTTLGTLSNASAGTPNSVTATIIENDQAPPPTIGARIYQIQGAQHRSPMNNMAVSNVPGIVTARAANGFYMQDGDGDGNPATSDGIFVFTSSVPPAAAAVGAQVLVSGTVSEFRPGNDAENLTVTQIGSPTVTPYVGNALFSNTVITPTILGSGGRIPPTDIVDNDSLGNVETSGTSLFDPAQDGLDFHESLEGMLVQVNNARATGPRNSFGEVWVLGDNGANATGVTARGGVALVERATGIDYNPERIQLDDGLNGITMPAGINTGDSLGTVTGVVSYSFDNYEVLLTQAPTVTVNSLPPGVRSIQVGGDRLSVGAYNVENLDPNDTSFARLAGQIVNAIGAPDVLALSELQDNNGATNNGTVSADQTIALLRDAIVAAGGPSYEAVQINPVNNQDGGEPGGNIRVVQFYNPLRVSFVPGTAGSGGSLDATAPTLIGGKLALTLSPGRVAPTDSAWSSSRKPLAVTYDFNGRRVVIVNVHFNSKGGDQPLFGVNQPAVLSSEVQRRQQATLVNSFVDSLQSLDPQARVLVLGDLNDFDFSAPLRILRTGAAGTRDTLRNLGTELVANPAERYSYVFEGNSQELDHILSTPRLLNAGAQYEALHINAEYADQASDHDALLSSFLLPANAAPVARAGSDRTVGVGATVTLDGTASTDSDGNIAAYAWVQAGGPAVSLSGADTATPSFIAPAAAASLSFTLTVTDDDGATGTDSIGVTVAADTTPNPFTFIDVLNVPRNSLQTSNPITVSGIDAAAPVVVSGGFFGVNGGPCTQLSGTVFPADQVVVCHTASADYLTATNTTLTIGADGVSLGVSDTYTSTTEAAPVIDTTPDAFAFADSANVANGVTVLSNSIRVAGINAPAAISIVSAQNQGRYSINGGPFTATPGTVNVGDSVQLSQIIALPGQTVPTTLTIGGVQAVWTVRSTTAADTTPDSFRFVDLSDQASAATVRSERVKITGINAPAPISISGNPNVMYRINNGPLTREPGLISRNNSILLQTVSGPNAGDVVSATITVGGVSDEWTVTTGLDQTPDSFKFPARSNAQRGAFVASKEITISGLNGPAPISIDAGARTYSINGRAYSGPSTVVNGDRVQMLVAASSAPGGSVTATLTVGTFSAAWIVNSR